MTWSRSAIVVAALTVSVSSVAARDMADYEVVGEARRSDSNARTRALDQAFAKAVNRALRDVLSASLRRRHKKTLRASIIRRARLHVLSYRVHEQRVVEGKLQVKVGVLVDRDKLRAALKRLGIEPGRAAATNSGSKRPKVIVLLHTTVAGKTHVTYGNAPTGRTGGSAGKAFIAELRRRGFDVLMSKGTPPISRNAGPGLPFDDIAAYSMAKKANVGGVFIIGIQVRSGGVIRGTKLKGATGRAHVRLLDVTKRKLIAAATITGAGFGADPTAAATDAAKAVSGKAVDKLGDVAQRYWPTTPAVTDGLAIVVRGDLHWKAIAALLTALRAATEVTAADARRFQPGVITLVVRGAINNLDSAAAVVRAAAIVNRAKLGSYTLTSAPEGTYTLAVTITANKTK